MDSSLPSEATLRGSQISKVTVTEQGDKCYNIEGCTWDQSVRKEMVHCPAGLWPHKGHSYHALLGMPLLPLFPKKQEAGVSFTSTAPVCLLCDWSTHPLSLNSLAVQALFKAKRDSALWYQGQPKQSMDHELTWKDSVHWIESIIIELYEGPFGVVQPRKRSVTQLRNGTPHGILVFLRQLISGILLDSWKKIRMSSYTHVALLFVSKRSPWINPISIG